jgi:hypothetical protein
VFTYRSVLDLYRYSIISPASGVVDWTADARSKYFSIDGGNTQLTTFSTGVDFGDGRQASHWQDGLGIGIMDPTASAGELLGISSNDILALDVIGWNVTTTPEPGSIGLGLFGLAAIWIGSNPMRKRGASNGASATAR